MYLSELIIIIITWTSIFILIIRRHLKNETKDGFSYQVIGGWIIGYLIVLSRVISKYDSNEYLTIKLYLYIMDKFNL